MMMRHTAVRLFNRRPSDIVEHPTDLQITAREIPNGKIEGWWCYALQQCNGSRSEVLGPFDPVVERASDGPLDTPRIKAPDGALYWYEIGKDGDLRPSVPCWYQSGVTLRFIRKPLEEKTENET